MTMSEAANVSKSRPVSFAPAIFVPFKGVPTNLPKSATREEKLQRSLEILDKHHDAVRTNMLHLAFSQKDKIAEDAEFVLQEQGLDFGGKTMSITTIVSEEERNAIIKRLRNPARKDAKPGHYEFQVSARPGRNHAAHGGVDIVDDDNASRARVVIHLTAAEKIRSLVADTAENLERYETIARKARDGYFQALRREQGKARVIGRKRTVRFEDDLDGSTERPAKRTFVNRDRDPRLH